MGSARHETKAKRASTSEAQCDSGEREWDIRFIQINIHLLIARVPFRIHDVLNVVQEAVETFVDDEASLAFRVF
jgi:hypothetical protein